MGQPPEPVLHPTVQNLIDLINEVDAMHEAMIAIQPNVSKADTYWAIQTWYTAKGYVEEVQPGT